MSTRTAGKRIELVQEFVQGQLLFVVNVRDIAGTVEQVRIGDLKKAIDVYLKECEK